MDILQAIPEHWPCLLIVYPEIDRLAGAVCEVSSTYGMLRLSIGRELAAALLPEPVQYRPRAARRWGRDRLGSLSPGPVLCSDVDPRFTFVAQQLRCVRDRFRETQAREDRLWLHYGLTLLTYSVFREVAATIGQLGRFEERIQPAMVKQRLTSSRGQLGSLEKAVERIMFSLRDWDILAESEERYAVVPQRGAFAASTLDLEAWLLACAQHAHPAQELPFADLVRLPELFPFRFALGVDRLRQHPWFAVQRQGSGWDMVRLEKREVEG